MLIDKKNAEMFIYPVQNCSGIYFSCSKNLRLKSLDGEIFLLFSAILSIRLKMLFY